MENQKKLSETAVVTASLRAMGCYEPDETIRCRDHMAEMFLPAEKRESIKSPEVRISLKKIIPAGLYEYVLARTHCFDEIFTDALKTGVSQIIVLGAGFDSRSYRFADKLNHMTVYELDSYATQDAKQQILKENGIPFGSNIISAKVDFETEDLNEVLMSAGFDSSVPALFVAEGLTFYLKPETVDKMLGSMRRCSAPKSTLCFDYQTLDMGKGLIDTGLKDESIQFGMENDFETEYLHSRGYEVIEIIDASEMEKRYLTGKGGVCLGRIDRKMKIIKAEIK